MDGRSYSGYNAPSDTQLGLFVQNVEKKQCTKCRKSLPYAAFHRSTFQRSTFRRSTFQRNTSWNVCHECTLKRSSQKIRHDAMPPSARERQTPQLPLPQMQVRESEQHHHSSRPIDVLPEQNTSHESIYPSTPATTTPKLEAFQGYRWQDVKILQYDSNTATTELDRSLTKYTLANRLYAISNRWHPRNAQNRDQRFDILREINAMLSLMDSGRINPWPPFRAWFELYRSERDPNQRYNAKTGMAVFKAARVASEQLEAIAMEEMEKAAEQLNGLLPMELPSDFLARLKADVTQECRNAGCFGLKGVLTQEDIRQAKFPKSWKAGGTSNA